MNSGAVTSFTSSERINMKADEAEVLEIYRRAKKMGYADISITVQEGTRVKLWLTEKIR